MGRNHLCEQAIPEDPAHLLHKPCGPCRPSGLSFGFPKLSPSRRQLDYVLLARPPLYSPCGFRVRLACLIHAANVRSEPGSNPSLEKFIRLVCRLPCQLAPTGRLRCCPNTRPGPLGPHRAPRATASLTHIFFRGHPECQRSRTGPLGLKCGGGEGSEQGRLVKPGLGFSGRPSAPESLAGGRESRSPRPVRRRRAR